MPATSGGRVFPLRMAGPVVATDASNRAGSMVGLTHDTAGRGADIAEVRRFAQKAVHRQGQAVVFLLEHTPAGCALGRL